MAFAEAIRPRLLRIATRRNSLNLFEEKFPWLRSLIAEPAQAGSYCAFS